MKKLLFMALVGFTLAAAPLTTNQQALVKALRKSSEVLKNMAAGSTGLTDEAIIQRLEDYITKNITTDPAAIKKIEANLAHAFSDDKATSALSYKDMFDVYEVADFFHIPIVLEKTAAPKKLIDELKSNSEVLKNMEEGSHNILTDRDILTYLDTHISHNLGIADPIAITKVESNLASLLAGNIDASTLTYHDAVNLYDIADYLNIPSKVLEPLASKIVDELTNNSIKRLPQSEGYLKEALEKVIADKHSEIFSLSVEFNEIQNQMVSLLSLDSRGTLVAKSEVDNKLKELNEKWATYKSNLDTIITATINAAQFKDIDVSDMKEIIKVGMISPMIEQLTPVFDSLKEVATQYTNIRAGFGPNSTLQVVVSILPFFTPFSIIKAITAIIYEFVDLIKIKLGLPLSLSYDMNLLMPEDATLAGTGEALDRIELVGEQLEKVVADLQHAMATLVQKPVSEARLEQSSDNDVSDQHIYKAPVVSDTHTTVTVQKTDAATKIATDLQAQLPGIKKFIDDLHANERQNENTIIEQISQYYPFNKNEITAFRTYIKSNSVSISNDEHAHILTILTARPELKPFMAERVVIASEPSVYKELMA